MAYWNGVKLGDLEIGLIVDLEFTNKQKAVFEAVKVIKFIEAGVPLSDYDVDAFIGTERELFLKAQNRYLTQKKPLKRGDANRRAEAHAKAIRASCKLANTRRVVFRQQNGDFLIVPDNPTNFPRITVLSMAVSVPKNKLKI